MDPCTIVTTARAVGVALLCVCRQDEDTSEVVTVVSSDLGASAECIVRELICLRIHIASLAIARVMRHDTALAGRLSDELIVANALLAGDPAAPGRAGSARSDDVERGLEALRVTFPHAFRKIDSSRRLGPGPRLLGDRLEAYGRISRRNTAHPETTFVLLAHECASLLGGPGTRTVVRAIHSLCLDQWTTLCGALCRCVITG
ncbi:MAG: hypothetical protein L0271_00960 [Gemmatimonadetes bacterium]|nr:hypothetical protein [Gemmatimonadota bacterium]